jgi:N-acetylglucosaminyldiphosphoundecaprenol N-acetyl-beta-D-mannosaminyltransferase
MALQVEGRGAFRCCGVRIDAVTLDDAVSRLHTFAQEGGGRAVHLCNAYTLSLARCDGGFAEAVNRGDLNLPDGTPLTWVGRRAGFTHMHHRVYGPDLLLAAAQAGRAWGLRHYLYGSTPEVAGQLARRLGQLASGVKLVGVEAPPFRPLSSREEAAMVARIRATRPDVVWIGLGTPRQDLFLDRFRDRLDTTLVAVGAAFDFLAGTKRQAPTWMQDRGLEWAFRFATEPRRLWRRYLIGNAVFLAGIAKGVEVYTRPGDVDMPALGTPPSSPAPTRKQL